MDPRGLAPIKITRNGALLSRASIYYLVASGRHLRPKCLRLSIVLTFLTWGLTPSALSGACAFPASTPVHTELPGMSDEEIFLKDLLDNFSGQDHGHTETEIDSLNLSDSPFHVLPEYYDEESLFQEIPHPQDQADKVQASVKACGINESQGDIFKAAEKRRNYLLKELQTRTVTYSDETKKGVYKEHQHHVFCADIINLMCRGNNILRCGKDFTCIGTIDLSTCRPQKHVAVAMFEALAEHRPSKFDVAFYLSFQGYRREEYYFFSILETALVVACVHPCRTRIQRQRGVDIKAQLQNLWEKVRWLPEKLLTEQLAQEPEYRRCIIYQLYMLQQNNILTVLESMKKDLNQRRPGFFCKKDSVKSIAHAMLIAQIDTPVSLKLLMYHYKDSFLKDTSNMNLFEFRASVLDLAFDGTPLVYDKKTEKVMIVSTEREAVLPPERTNFLTLIYDCACEYRNGMSLPEIAYFAHTMGYWRVDNQVSVRDKMQLFKDISQAKRFLAILGLTTVESCARQEQPHLKQLNFLWDIFQKERYVLRDLSYYQAQTEGIVKQNDLTTILQVQEFIAREDYAVLLDHIARRTTKEHQWTKSEMRIRQALGNRALSELDLWRLCKGCEITDKDGYWDALKSLTKKNGRGRVVFDLNKGHFLWDETSCFKEQPSRDIQLELFRIRKHCTTYSSELITFILHQRGFKTVREQTVQHMTTGLRVLGLWSESHCKRDLSPQRSLLNTILASESKKAPKASGKPIWRQYAVERMASWKDAGIMERLWKAYLEERDQHQALPPQPKRRKTEEKRTSPEQIISTEIPALKKFLIKKKLWLYEEDSSCLASTKLHV